MSISSPAEWQPFIEGISAKVPPRRNWLPHWAFAVERTATELQNQDRTPENQAEGVARLRNLTAAGVALSLASGHHLPSMHLILKVNDPTNEERKDFNPESTQGLDIPGVRRAVEEILLQCGDPSPYRTSHEGRQTQDVWRGFMDGIPIVTDVNADAIDAVWVPAVRSHVAELLVNRVPTEHSAATARDLLNLVRARFVLAHKGVGGHVVGIATAPLRPLIGKHTGLSNDDLTLTRWLPHDAAPVRTSIDWLMHTAR